MIELAAVIVIALSLRRERTPLGSIVGYRPDRIRPYFLAGLAALPLTLAAGWLYSLGQAQAGVESDLGRFSQQEIILSYVLIPLPATFMEEVIWRGYAIPLVSGVWRSLLFTSVSFALFHGIFNPLAIVATLVQGLVWGWAYQRTGSTIPSMGLHFMSRYLAIVL